MKCPGCGEGRLGYIKVSETYTAYHDIEEVTYAEGKMFLTLKNNVGEMQGDWDGHNDHQFCCDGCGHTWTFPEYDVAEIVWSYYKGDG